MAEIIAGASSEKADNTWQKLGFSLRRQDAIHYLDRRKLLSSETVLHLSLIDGELAFMYNPDRPYIS